MITTLETGARLDVFEPGDLTALVCHDVPEVRRLIVEQLSELGYKIHTGLYLDDILLKMRTHLYDVVALSAHFNAVQFEDCPIYRAATGMSPPQRRKQFIALVGSQFATGDETQSFAASVDLVIGLADVVTLRPVFRRSVQRHQELYAPLREAEKLGPVR
jgi:CheY-like chemotaxis protein